jgi:hypothetical protein
MRRKLTWVVLFSAAIVATALYQAGRVSATPANSGFTSTSLTPVLGRFGLIEVFNHFTPPSTTGREHEHNRWLSLQKTKGDSDLYVQSNVWQPGGSTGWHTHLGHSLIIVTAGTMTAYEGDDPDCTPHSHTAGMGFVDPGNGHVHMVRNESTTDVAQAVAVQLIPAGQPRRIDAADPGNCHF